MKITNHEHLLAKPSMLPGYSETYIKLSKGREIFFSEDFCKENSAQLAALLLYYDNLDHEKEITVYIHSNGGDASGLVNIYDVMQMISAPVKTVCIGKCYSAGAVMLASGTKGMRYAFKSSKIMIQGFQFGFPLPGQDIITSKNYYQFLKENNDIIMKILANHTGHSLEKLKSDCSEDMWMDAKTALEYGIIDHIIG